MSGAGRFITVEGLEGAGKTTCLEAVQSALEQSGITDCLLTREPGGTDFGEALRKALLDPAHQGITPEAEALAVFAARAEHLARVIRPALEAGRWVVCDRFTDATYAYQGGGRELGDARIAELEAWVHGGFAPDLTLLLDVDLETGRRRIAERSGGADRFEQEADAFFHRARAAYRRRVEAHPERFRVLDATESAASVSARVRAEIAALVEREHTP